MTKEEIDTLGLGVGDRVSVYWDDIVGFNDWRTMEEFMDMTSSPCGTDSRYFNHDEKDLRLYSTKSVDGEYNDGNVIPIGCIVNITVVKEA